MGQWGGARDFCTDKGPSDVLVRLVPHVRTAAVFSQISPDDLIESLHITHVFNGGTVEDAADVLKVMQERYVGKPYSYWAEFQWKPPLERLR
jgi:hypothetical protein